MWIDNYLPLQKRASIVNVKQQLNNIGAQHMSNGWRKLVATFFQSKGMSALQN